MRTIITMMIILLMTCVVAVSGHSKIRQKRDWIVDSFTIEEESRGPFPYSLGIIHVDRKYLVEFILTGKGVTEEPKGVLSIDNNTGEVLVHKKVDYEQDKVLMLKFEARDVEKDKVDTRLGVEIKVQDINDHAPVFKPLNIETTLDESYPQGKSVITVSASDGDDSSTPNGTFTFRLLSATPETDNVEFFIRQDNNIGNIYFKGCLNYEKAQKYTLRIEAKDHGDKVQLSNTSTVVLNIIDQNNHLPEITGHTGNGTIKERDSGVEVLRLTVSDKDSPGSPAWKAKFTLHGDKENHFKIQTDPKTNEGILTVVKAMDYEKQTSKNVSISVENEVPYVFCKVKNRPSQGLWDIETSTEGAPKHYPVTILVENINDPPEFVPPIQVKAMRENTKVGTSLYTLTAIDPDMPSGGSFQFVKGEDKDNWVTVDPKTGKVSVAKVMDRESPFVKNNRYSVIMYAVENAQPALTGTGTLIIHLLDENDNVPLLVVNKINMCLSDKETKTNITAVDLDLQPYSAPFRYELLGDVKGKWRIEPNSGTTVNLIREKNVYSSHYEFQVKISDSQGFGSVQNLSITVCNCSITPRCNVRGYMTAGLSLSAIGIVIFALLSLLVFLLVAFLISCKQKKIMFPIDETTDHYLLKWNTETPGTECKMPNKTTQMDMSENSVKTSPGAQNGISTRESVFHKVQGSYQSFATSTQQKMSRRTLQRGSHQSFATSTQQKMSRRTLQSDTMSRKYSTYSSNVSETYSKLSFLLEQHLLQIKTKEDLCDYEPHCYANEGELETDGNLDTSFIMEMDFNPDILTNLDVRFKHLATVCRPDLSYVQ